MALIQIGSWQTLLSNGASVIAFDGKRMAAAGSARLKVWQGNTLLATADASFPAPGAPRFASQRVYWGAGFLDLGSGRYTRIAGAEPVARPGTGERPHVYAWSPQGDRMIGSFSTGDPRRPVRVTLFRGQTGVEEATLFDGTGLPPSAAWFGARAAVVGFSDPQVFDRSGAPMARIALGGGTIACIDATGGEQRVIVVDLNRAIHWIDPATWTVLDRWPGPWMHGAVSQDGRLIAVLEPWGKLHFASMEEDRFRPAGQIAVDDRAVAVALNPGEIATVGGGEVRRASLRID
jgi:hypothetical protein